MHLCHAGIESWERKIKVARNKAKRETAADVQDAKEKKRQNKVHKKEIARLIGRGKHKMRLK